MTPKEKALELVRKFLTASHGTMEEYVPVPYIFAKQCALIAVDEILKAVEGKYDEYWQEVKQEIENL